MKKTAFIWRKSMYDNGFKCNKCGRKCVGDDLQPTDDMLCMGPVLICPDCKNEVAFITEIDAPESMEGMQGYFGDFLDGKVGRA